jgi:hypothetical protein
MSNRKRRPKSLSSMGPKGQAVVDGLLARVTELEVCEHDLDGFAMWIGTRPDRLLCRFCYQTAQVLAQDIRCAACGQLAGDPDRDAIMVLKIADWLGLADY